jgi:cholesterol transport system auxiliary component
MKKGLFIGCLVIASAFLNGCSELLPKATKLPSFYLLSGIKLEGKATESESITSKDTHAAIAKKKLVQATLIVNLSTAAAGFDSARMVYSRVPYKQEYFAHSQWIDTPARMLTPLIVNALKAKSIFSAVTISPNSANSHYALDTQIIRLQQEFFSPQSRERFTLRATLIDNTKHEVIFVRDLDVVVTAKTENPYGGVVAANEAVQMLLEQLVVLCNEAVMNYL